MFLPFRKSVLALVLSAQLAAPTLGSGQGTRAVAGPVTRATTVNAVTSTVTLGGGKAVVGAQGVALDPSTGLVYIGLNGAIVSGCAGDGSVAGGTTVAAGPGAGQISVVDPARSLEIAAVASGGAPVWPTVDPDRGVVYMSNSGAANVTVHNAATGTRLSTIAIGGKPYMGGLDYSVTST